ncbi:Tetratricopeptide repeat protein 23 isoform X1 [Oopsacas minuta]|uniref:Tetratricopeptide repeat protein 23 isoform X1 n=1 Tax=Oopsacas minuta TaxID=111878 RepID=A0AAV7JEQ7_9METZ|nr:Tetratricopeptide repeat protein 23 isoform X1 [Oopsacas minuta]
MARILWQSYWCNYITEHNEWPLFSNSEQTEILPDDTTILIPYQHPSYQSSPKFLLTKLVSSIGNLFTYEQSDICIDTLLRCLALSRFIYESDSIQIASFYVSLALAYLELKQNYLQAIKHCQNAMKIIDLQRLSFENISSFSAVLLNIKTSLVFAKSLLLQQKHSESLNLLKQANSDSKLLQTLNPNFRDSTHIVFVHYLKGHVHKSMIKYKSALGDFTACLELIKHIFGAKEEHTVWPMIEIVEVLIEIGSFENALGYAEKCYELGRDFEVLKPDVALVLAKLHFTAKSKNAYTNSAKFYDEWASTVDMEKAQNSSVNFSRLVSNFEQYILVLSKIGNQQKTYIILVQLISIYTTKYGDMCSEVGNLNRQLGLCYLTEGNVKMGVEQLEQSRRCYDFSLGKNNKESKNIEQILSRVDPTHKYQTISSEKPQDNKIRFKTIV